ncbi:MAG TPA: MarR family transcriptional regulator [Caulobacterales bacterium]|nr:MarR family transcriptional regulator [Caulobacterales bacterium]
MPVNQTRPSAAGSEGRLYLKEDELDRAVDLVFAAARRFWKTAEDVLEAHELGPAHYRALAAIRREEGLPVSDLQARLGVRKQSLARVLGELEKSGLIARAPGRQDRRQRLLTLTPHGRDAEREASAALRERLGQIFRAAGADAVAGARIVLSALAEDER